MKEQEIIAKLSEMHNDGSSDPETLSLARLQEFNWEHHPYGTKLVKLQGMLLGICIEREDDWTEI